MAYVTQYTSVFSNELNHRVQVDLQLKDGDVVEPEEFESKDLEINVDSEENTILVHECVFTIVGSVASSITWETFLPNTYDAWKIIITIGAGDTEQRLFEGFLTPEEGHTPFLDKPSYDITVRATNGLKLLKDVSLKQTNGQNFKGKYAIIELICAAISFNLLQDIPIRIYCSLYESSMQNREDDIFKDWYSQAKLDHRTFMKDAVTFESCYDALVKILGRHSRFFYWNGRYVIFFMPEHQNRPLGLFYTEYNPDGTVITAEEDTEGHAKVGPAELIYPYSEDGVSIAAKFGIKFARTDFKYEPWAEIPLNNKFERGTVFESGPAPDDDDIDNDGDTAEIIGTYKKYTIDDWEWGSIDSNDTTPPLPALDAGEGTPYLRRVFDVYGVELKRELHLPVASTSGKRNWLRSEGLPVSQGDKIKLSVQAKFDFDFTSSGPGSAAPMMIYIIPDQGGGAWGMQGQVPPNTGQGEWEFDAESSGEFLETLAIIYQEDQNSTKYVTLNVESFAIPTNGTLYIVFNASHRFDSTTKMILSDFQFEYKPFVAGGYVQVKGDYWQHTQNANMIDADSEEMFISDSRYKMIKGTIWREDGVNVTTPTWYRYGIPESRHFKEIVNVFRFNLAYRRFYKIEGSFTGLFYEASNDQLIKQLISFHKEYSFENLNPKRRFILAPPLRMNIGTGNITAEFQEILNPDDSTTEVETVDQVMFRLISGINRKTEDDWNAEGAAPPSGTVGFKPASAPYPYNPRQILISLNDGDTATASANANGAGNSPSLTETYNEVVSPGVRWQIFEIGTDIAEGNIFTITIYDVAINVTVREITLYADGSQLGDTQTFNYIF